MHQHRPPSSASQFISNGPRRSSTADPALEPTNIKKWLGYPVTRTICDRHGQVILEVGDLVTHQALHQAWEAGVLHVLLSALYRGSAAAPLPHRPMRR